MNRKSKLFVAAAMALAGTLGVGAAQARDDVQWSVTVGSTTPVYTQPVYTQPAPVYHPAPVYQPAPVVYQPAPVYQHPTPRYRDRYHDRDRDHDGRIERNGRVLYDADHDGIPNGRDSFDNRVFRHNDVDGDGIPNWKDGHDARTQPVWWRPGYHPSYEEANASPYRRRHH